MALKLKRSLYLIVSFLIMWGAAAVLFTPGQAAAGQITTRSLTLQGVTGPPAYGGSEPGVPVNHYFQFTIPSGTSVQSIQFQYCLNADNTSADPSCIAPPGMTAAGATVANLSAGLSGFTSINTTTANAPYIYAASGADISGAQTVTLDGVTNPTLAVGPPAQTTETFFVRISTFASNNATGTPIDTGNVAAAVTNQIQLSGQMPESLVFCDGGTISETSGVPDCTTATSADVDFTTLFSSTATAIATSQMAASTNAGSGFVITLNGNSLCSGSNCLTEMNSTGTSTLGVSQFGTNLVSNTTPTVGSAITPTSDGVNYKGEPLTGYGTANNFTFNNGASIADSNEGGAGGTEAQIYTNSYIVNVPGNQPAGTYTTTLTYICTPYF